MKTRPLSFTMLWVLPLLTGCAVSFEAARELQSGRMALRVNQPKVAIPHLEAAARQDPQYVTGFILLESSVWTYLGRAYLEAGEQQKARESFERARETHPGDYLGRAYLGAVLVQDGRRAEGVQEVKTGLQGLHDWLDRLPSYSFEGRYWDPGGEIRKAMTETLALVEGERTDWAAVLENVKWIGQELDEEHEEVQYMIELEKQDDGGDSTP